MIVVWSAASEFGRTQTMQVTLLSELMHHKLTTQREVGMGILESLWPTPGMEGPSDSVTDSIGAMAIWISEANSKDERRSSVSSWHHGRDGEIMHVI